MCPGPGVGLPGSGHATGWIWLARSSYPIGVSMPSDECQPRRFRRDQSRRAGRGGRYPAPWLRPRGLPAGKASRIHHGLGQAGRHTGRAGRLTTIIAQRIWSPSGTGRTRDGPVSMRDLVPARAGHAPRPGCSLQPYSLAGREVPAAGRLASHTVSTSRAFRDRLAKASSERGPRPWRGAACTTKRSRWRRAL